ncbi:MAG: lytic transglycosylase domain-containing protein [Spirochaetia bacterium]|nr:lytic transglycosylase domain-containing protein [Spirochaetota bacterium]MCX8097188.1 lytic transglycosylase domain-containing protein [Spirochaetota bacterium]MDW8112639.1 lytic transglycosylase domain-containing protein [Spirochaetia bacterium]
MVEGVSSIYSRIRSIYDRINEIQRQIGSVYSTINLNSVQRTYNYQVQQESSQANQGKTFQDVLNEVILESKSSDSDNKVNILSKTESSWKEVLLSTSESRDNKFDEIIEEASKRYDLPKELIKAVIKAESNFNPIAISPKNAMGLMQLIPSTAMEMGVEDVFDPFQNIMGGTKYLRKMLDRFNGNLFLALSAYNAGPERVSRSGGIPDIEETKDYVDRVIRFYKEYSTR